MKTYYLCDGNVKNCSKEECYITGGCCRHTENLDNAKNRYEKRVFIINSKGDKWEIITFKDYIKKENYFGGEIMLEKNFQSSIIKELKERFPNCIILKNDPSYKQGIPDLIILYEDRWATLECKKNVKAQHRPNQDYYVNIMNDMSFSSFIYPENRQKVLDDLEDFMKN